VLSLSIIPYLLIMSRLDLLSRGVVFVKEILFLRIFLLFVQKVYLLLLGMQRREIFLQVQKFAKQRPIFLIFCLQTTALFSSRLMQVKQLS